MHLHSHATALKHTVTCPYRHRAHMQLHAHAPTLNTHPHSYMSHTCPHAYISINENNSLKIVHPPDNLKGIMGDRIPNYEKE